MTIDEFQSGKKLPIVLVLENVRSLHNIGSVFRTADAFCIEAIFLCGYTAQPPHREINKTALGATDSVSWEYFQHTALAIERLRSKGFLIASLEQAEETVLLDAFKPVEGRGIGIVMGNEVKEPS